MAIRRNVGARLEVNLHFPFFRLPGISKEERIPCSFRLNTPIEIVIETTETVEYCGDIPPPSFPVKTLFEGLTYTIHRIIKSSHKFQIRMCCFFQFQTIFDSIFIFPEKLFDTGEDVNKLRQENYYI